MDTGKKPLGDRIVRVGLVLLLCFSMVPFSLAGAEEYGEEGAAAVAHRHYPTSDEIDWDSIAAGVDYEEQCMLVVFVPDISLEDAWAYIENQDWKVGPTSPIVWDEEDGIKCLDAYVPEGQSLRDAMREAESSDLVRYADLNYYNHIPGDDDPFEFTRLAGDYALDTMEAVVSEGFPDGSDTVIVARMDSYYDALSAAGLAGALDCPVLMTDPGFLSPQTEGLIGRLGASRAIIAGGPLAVSGDVERQIVGLPGIERVDRVWGDYARDTARAAYEAGMGSWGGTAVVCTADSYLDAMAASPYAFAKRAPVFLTDSSRMLDAETLVAIASGGFSEVIVMGGYSAVDPAVEGQLSRVVRVSRMAGDDAYETASLLADRCLRDGMHADGAGVTTALAYYDALCAGPVLGRAGAPVLYANKGHVDRAEAFFTANAASIERGYVLGGYAAVSRTIECDLADAVYRGSAS